MTKPQLHVIVWMNLQFSSVAQSCLTLCDPMNRSMPGLPVHHQLPEFTQIHVHRVSDAIQPSHPLSSPSPPAPIPPSIRVFSNESTLRMRWPKHWSFSFSILAEQILSKEEWKWQLLSCVWRSATPWTTGSPVHGIIWARILEQVAIPFSRGSSQLRDQT